MAELNEHFCMICGATKNDLKSITCGHPKCINAILECIKDEGQFMYVARINGINDPNDLKKRFKNVLNLKIMDVKDVKKLKESLISMLSVLNTEDLQKIIDEIKIDTEKLE